MLLFLNTMFQNSFKGTSEYISSFADMYVVFPQHVVDSFVSMTFPVHLQCSVCYRRHNLFCLCPKDFNCSQDTIIHTKLFVHCKFNVKLNNVDGLRVLQYSNLYSN